jgi:hypothetical protein
MMPEALVAGRLFMVVRAISMIWGIWLDDKEEGKGFEEDAVENTDKSG